MNAEIICVAAESLPAEHSGFIASYISKKLFELGHRTLFETNCVANAEILRDKLSQGLSRSDLVIILGGIEPEADFASKKAVALITGELPTENEAALLSVKNYCQSIGAELNAERYSVASAPKGAEIYKNELGLCPGISVLINSKRVILLPYAEGELTHMFESLVAPTLSGHGITASKTVNVIGLSEADIEARLSRLSNRSEFALNIIRRGVEFAVRVSSVAATQSEAEALCSRAVASVSVALGRAAYAVDSKGIQFEAVKVLSEKGLSVSTAESCTGGLVSEMLTDVSGSSKVFEYGISAYSNRIKTEILKVPEAIITSYSAISRETAMYMAKNVREISGSTIGISITGNAGPEPSEGKAVGVVFVGIADKTNYYVTELSLSPTLSRDDIRAHAAAVALNLIRRYAESYPTPISGMIKYNETVTESVAPMPIITEEPVAEPEPITAEPVAEPIFEESRPKAEPSEHRYNMVFDREDDFVTDDSDDYDFITANRASLWAKPTLEKFKGFGGAFLSAIKRIFPTKGDTKKKIITKVAFLVSLITLITSATVICLRLTSDNKERNIIAAAQERWHFDPEEREEDGTYSAFVPFTQENEDIKGWITVPGTKVDNPVYQTTDNDFYLTHNMNKEPSRYGAIFFDFRCSLDPKNPSQNVTVYGHDMRDGSMFGSLKSYKKLDFYKANPTFALTGLTDHSTYKIFAVMVVNAKASDDNGYLYNYTVPSFTTQESFLKWVDEARERSLINTTVEVGIHDQIVTLVTCTNDFPDARLVIMARATRYGEDSSVNTDGAVLNSNPRYPQAWYDKRGQEGFKSTDSGSSLPESEPSGSEGSSSGSGESSEEGSSSDTSSSDTGSVNGSSTEGGSSEPTTSSAPTSSNTENETPESSSEPEGGENTNNTSTEPEGGAETA